MMARSVRLVPIKVRKMNEERKSNTIRFVGGVNVRRGSMSTGRIEGGEVSVMEISLNSVTETVQRLFPVDALVRLTV